MLKLISARATKLHLEYVDKNRIPVNIHMDGKTLPSADGASRECVFTVHVKEAQSDDTPDKFEIYLELHAIFTDVPQDLSEDEFKDQSNLAMFSHARAMVASIMGACGISPFFLPPPPQ